MSGGQKLDEFVTKHFTKVGGKNPRTNRWKMKCNYYTPDAVVEHRELRCTEHFSKYELCPGTPGPVAHMHTRKGGGVNPWKVVDLTRNWTIQSPLTSRTEEGEEDTELMGLKDITAEELDAEFDRLWPTATDPQNMNQQQARPLPGEAPPTTAEFHEVYNLDEIGTIRRGVSPWPAREEPTIHDRVGQPGAWDPADILRDYKIF